MNRAIVLLSIILLPVNMAAAQFAVALTSVDAVDANPGDFECRIAAAAPGEPGCTLRAALMEANASAGRDRIVVPSGANIVLSLSGRDEDGAATGDLDVLDDVTITTVDAPTTLADYARIDANGIDRVLDIKADTKLVGLIITGGIANTASSPQGGGVKSFTDQLVIEDSRITGNSANIGAGLDARGSLDLSRSRIDHNTTLDLGFTNAYGCAIHDKDSSTPTGDFIHISNSTIDHNTCISQAVLQLRTNTQIDNSTISDNTAPKVLSMYVGNVSLNNVTIVGNETGYSIGSIDGTTTSTLRNTIIVGQNGHAACEIHSAIADHDWTLASDSSCAPTSGTHNLPDTDPLLGPLANRYSVLPVRQPRAGGPAVDAGDPATCLAEYEDGLSRPIDGDGDGTARCDIGAIELDDVIFADGFE